MTMSRSDFLRLAALTPTLRGFSQSVNRQAPKSGSLVVIGKGSPARILLAEGQDFSWREITSGYHPTVLFSPDRKRLFVCFAAQPGVDRGQAHLTVIDFSNGGAVASFAYPGPLSARGVSLGLSTDGRWLYTLTGREPEAERWRRPGQGGSHPEMASVYTFDAQESQFLPQAAVSPYEFYEGMAVVAEIGLRGVSIGPVGPGLLMSVFIEGKGNAARTNGSLWNIEMTRQKAGAFQVVLTPDGRKVYCIQSNGFVTKSDRSPGEGTGGSGQTDAFAPDRFLGAATVSGDGRLLFLPSGPVEPSRTYEWRYLDRISVYRMSDLRKLREQALQRPLRGIWANADGTVLFATTVPSSQIAVLDAETLWQERVIDFAPLEVESISVVP